MSKSEGQILDFEKICRLCLVEKRSMSAIFSKKKSDKKVPLPIRIMSCASLELYEGDGLPASICSKCLLSVNQSYAFREQCEQADTTLRQYAQRMNETSEDASTKKTAAHNSRMNFEVGWKIQAEEEAIESNLIVSGIKDREGLEKTDSIDGSPPGEKSQVPLEVFDLIKTISEIQFQPAKSKKNSLEEMNLFKKLLCNKDVVVKRKESKDTLVTDENEKWLIIRTLSQCGKEIAKNQTEDGEMNESTLKCLESMMKRPKKSSDDSLVFCKECNLFMKRSSLSGHNRFVHEKIRKYLCQTCGYAAHTGSILRQHMQAVHVGYVFECRDCPRKFNLLKRLRKHEEMHRSNGDQSTEKKKICHYCGRGFRRLSYLKTHLLTHTGESPLQCRHCSRRFRFRWAMTQHERLHTGVKPYRCQHCGESFALNRIRKCHEIKVHSEAREEEN